MNYVDELNQETAKANLINKIASGFLFEPDDDIEAVREKLHIIHHLFSVLGGELSENELVRVALDAARIGNQARFQELEVEQNK